MTVRCSDGRFAWCCGCDEPPADGDEACDAAATAIASDVLAFVGGGGGGGEFIFLAL